jgi:hypothetical protein
MSSRETARKRDIRTADEEGTPKGEQIDEEDDRQKRSSEMLG